MISRGIVSIVCFCSLSGVVHLEPSELKDLLDMATSLVFLIEVSVHSFAGNVLAQANRLQNRAMGLDATSHMLILPCGKSTPLAVRRLSASSLPRRFRLSRVITEQVQPYRANIQVRLEPSKPTPTVTVICFVILLQDVTVPCFTTISRPIS
jgi:hypothetical protein